MKLLLGEAESILSSSDACITRYARSSLRHFCDGLAPETLRWEPVLNSILREKKSNFLSLLVTSLTNYRYLPLFWSQCLKNDSLCEDWWRSHNTWGSFCNFLFFAFLESFKGSNPGHDCRISSTTPGQILLLSSSSQGEPTIVMPDNGVTVNIKVTQSNSWP